MQEIIQLVSSIRKDIQDLRSQLSHMAKTHAQRINEEWLTLDQVMLILKISGTTLKNLKHSGKLPYSKINGLSYFRTMDIENLLKQHYIHPSSKDNHFTFNNKSDVRE